MEYIKGDYKTLIDNCLQFAAQFMFVPPTMFLFDGCPSERFPTMSNSAEGRVYPVKKDDGFYMEG